MKITLDPYDDPYPINSTRFILPTVAIRGWWKNGEVSVTAAFGIWRARWKISRNAARTDSFGGGDGCREGSV
jgi:hypothetical protein